MTTQAGVSPREAVRLYCQDGRPTHPALIYAAKVGHIRIVQEKPLLLDPESVQEYLAQKYNPHIGRPSDPMDLEELREKAREEHRRLALGESRPAEGTAINLSQAGRKYGVDMALLSQWAKRGWLTVLREPSAEGEAKLVDDASVWDRMQVYKPKPRKYGQRAMPLDNSPRPASRPSPSTPTPPPLPLYPHPPAASPHHPTPRLRSGSRRTTCPACGFSVCPTCGRPL